MNESKGAASLSRRGMLAGLALGGLTGCVGTSAESEPSKTSRSPAPVTSRATPSPPAVALEAVPAYKPLRGEVQPACKLAAIKVVSTALTWSPEKGGSDASLARLDTLDVAAGVESDLRALIGRQVASSFRTVYPQYGGLSDDLSSASIMVVGEQVTRAEPGASPERRDLTVDVRLKRRSQGWRVVAVHNPVLPPAQGNGTVLSRRVLAEQRLLLPTAARADIEADLIDERVLSLLAALSKRWEIHVQVLKSGHPRNVFPTNRVSNHTRGRAVDIWAIDGVPVISAPKASWRGLMMAAASRGATEIGGPADLDKVAGRPPFFTNAVHQDHIHIGFEA